ncbi:MAG: leader peptidase (prepilin peptidase) / N-methyltransferase [bacterium]|nr:MAG: leader peptidase (prepilin peptidase) / N-methyltransferase [bacterium]
MLLGGTGLIVGVGLVRLAPRLSPEVAASPPRPRRYALMALAAAGIGVWAALVQTTGLAAVLTALLGWQLLLIAVIDAEHFRLPDQLTLPLLVTGGLAAVLLDHTAPLDALTGAAAGFGALWLLAFVYRRLRGREGLGDGDPFLLAAGGAWVGWIGLPSVLLWASAAGLSMVGARLLVGSRVSAADRLPFGPCLAIGIWLTWMLGPLGL